MSDFLAPTADRSIKYNYKLHGVLVHSGDVHGGHYFGMIKPEKDSKWYRYDDERVIPVTLNEVLEENFGGDDRFTSPQNQHNGLLPQQRLTRGAAQWKRFTSAYMLVYLREDAIDQLLAPITENDVPEHVVRKVEEERIELARKKREKEEMHLFMTVKVIDAETFRHHEGVDLANFDPADKEAAEWIHPYRVRRDLTWAGLYHDLAQANNLPKDHIRIWHLVNRQNKTVRPDVPIPPDPQITIEAWLKSGSTPHAADLRLYLEKAEDIWHPTIIGPLPRRSVPPTPPPPPPAYADEHTTKPELDTTTSSINSSRSLSNGVGELETTNGSQEQTVDWPDVGRAIGVYNSRHDAALILIFLKWFDVENQHLRGQRSIYVNRQDKTAKLLPVIAEMMDWHAEPGEKFEIAMYEEIKPNMIEPVKPNSTFQQSEIQDGDIICFQRGISPKRYPPLDSIVHENILTVFRQEELLREGKCPDPIRFYEFLSNKITLKFIPRYTDQTVKEEFSCTLSKNMKYEQVAAKVAEHLQVDPTHLRFTPSTTDGRPRSIPIKRQGPQSTLSQMTMSGAMLLPPVVFYEVLELSLADMESRREMTITWLPEGVSVLEPVTLLVSRQATFEEVVQALVKKQSNIPPEIQERIRIFDVRGNKEYREFQPSQAISTANLDTSYGTNFFAEVIPKEEEEMTDQDKFIIVVHYAKELIRLHGVPVKFVVRPVNPLLVYFGDVC